MTLEQGGSAYALFAIRDLEQELREQELRRRATWGRTPIHARLPRRREAGEAPENPDLEPLWARRPMQHSEGLQQGERC